MGEWLRGGSSVVECGSGEGVVAQGRVVLDPRGRSEVREGSLGLRRGRARLGEGLENRMLGRLVLLRAENRG